MTISSLKKKDTGFILKWFESHRCAHSAAFPQPRRAGSTFQALYVEIMTSTYSLTGHSNNPSLLVSLCLCSSFSLPHILDIKYLTSGWNHRMTLCTWKNRYGLSQWWRTGSSLMPTSRSWPLLWAPVPDFQGLLGVLSGLIHCHMFLSFPKLLAALILLKWLIKKIILITPIFSKFHKFLLPFFL